MKRTSFKLHGLLIAFFFLFRLSAIQLLKFIFMFGYLAFVLSNEFHVWVILYFNFLFASVTFYVLLLEVSIVSVLLIVSCVRM